MENEFSDLSRGRFNSIRIGGAATRARAAAGRAAGAAGAARTMGYIIISTGGNVAAGTARGNMS